MKYAFKKQKFAIENMVIKQTTSFNEIVHVKMCFYRFCFILVRVYFHCFHVKIYVKCTSP